MFNSLRHDCNLSTNSLCPPPASRGLIKVLFATETFAVGVNMPTKTVLYMGIVGSASVLIGLMLLFWLPAYISKPLATFNKAIGEIARGNYKQTISGESKDEFGELARSFNTMAAKLDEYEHSSLAKILKEQKRLQAAISPNFTGTL